MVTEPHTLLSRVLKVKYFPSTFPLRASGRPSISFAWRNLLISNSMEIGDGQSINIWHDPWLPKPFLFKPLPYNQYLAENLRVVDLISSGPRVWNLQVLNVYFVHVGC